MVRNENLRVSGRTGLVFASNQGSLFIRFPVNSNNFFFLFWGWLLGVKVKVLVAQLFQRIELLNSNLFSFSCSFPGGWLFSLAIQSHPMFFISVAGGPLKLSSCESFWETLQGWVENHVWPVYVWVIWFFFFFFSNLLSRLLQKWNTQFYPLTRRVFFSQETQLSGKLNLKLRWFPFA